MALDWTVIWQYREEVAKGLWMTIQISGLSILFSTMVGLSIGGLRVIPSFFLQKILGLYLDVIRNIPAVVKLFAIHFVVGLDAFVAGVLALSLHQSAYIADVMSSSLNSLPKGQLEAALATGLSHGQAFRRVLLPQALRIAIPPLSTQFVQIVKNSAIVMLISLEDLTFVTNHIQLETFRGMEASIVVTCLYLFIAFAIIISMNLIQSWSNRRFQ